MLFLFSGRVKIFLRSIFCLNLNQSKCIIHWVKSFKDAYQKLLRSSKEYRQTLTGYSDLEMPFFYIRSTQFVASFRVDPELEGRVSVELRPHEKLANFIKKSKCVNNKLIEFIRERQLIFDP